MQVSRTVIGLVGPSKSGKGVVASYLESHWGFYRVPAGIAMKRAIGLGFGIGTYETDGPGLDLPCAALGGVAPRPVLEAMGAAVAKLAPRATALYWRSIVDALPVQFDRILADGVRLPAEADAVRISGGFLLRITRPQAPGNPNLPFDALQRELVADQTLVNDGDLAVLFDDVDRIVRWRLGHG